MAKKCSTCGKTNRSKRFKQCHRCRRTGASRAKKNYHRKKDNQQCVRCGEEGTGGPYCGDCLDYLKPYWRRR